MQRRGFLGAILAAGMAPAFVGAKVLMPVKALALPSLGWASAEEIVTRVGGGNRLLTIADITREALIILNNRTLFEENLSRKWQGSIADRLAFPGPLPVRKPIRMVR